MSGIRGRHAVRTLVSTVSAITLASVAGACSTGPAATVVTGASVPPASSPTAPAVALKQLDVLAKLPIDDAFDIAEAFGSIWVGANDSGRIIRIDPATNKVIATIQVSTFTSSVVPTEDSIWVIDGDAKAVRRIDPKTNSLTKDEIAIGDDGGGMQWYDGHLWQSGHGRAVRIDPTTGKTSTFQLPGDCGDCYLGIGGGQGYTDSNGTIQRIDLNTQAVLAANSKDVVGDAFGTGSDGLWAGSATASVALLDPITLALRRTFTSAPATAADGSTWGLGSGDGQIVTDATGAWVRFSAATLGHVNAASGTIDLYGPLAAASAGTSAFLVDADSIWITIGAGPNGSGDPGVWRLALPKP